MYLVECGLFGQVRLVLDQKPDPDGRESCGGKRQKRAHRIVSMHMHREGGGLEGGVVVVVVVVKEA